MSHIIFDRSTYQTPDTTPGADRDPIDLKSPLVTDPIAHMMPGPGGDAPHLVDVTTDFRLYIDDKAKRGKNKVVWRLIKPEAKFSLILDAGRQGTTYEEFHQIVATQCNEEYAHSKSIITRSITYGKPAITWTVTIPGVTEFKAPGERLLSEWSFKRRMSALRTGSKTKATLVLKMPNPSSVQARARNEDILQRQALRDAARMAPSAASQSQSGSQSQSRPPGDPNPSDSESDGSDIDANDFDNVNVYMNKLYKAHHMNAHYDRHRPVYLDPLNKRWYIVLSVGNCQEWAQALIDRKPGVSIISPPRSLIYHALTARQFAAMDRATKPGTPTPAPLQQEVTAPAQDPASIGDYLDFIGFSHNRQLILDILIANELTFYRIFGTPHMTTTHLITLNISPGVSASLCDNVGRYEQHLAARNH
ncbi:hypothetical protein Pst134EA_029452 [Puccinia striiformis f. sp. tritici]|uniref:hypothetical protein n=1 Tax=Puccinia striiformis f. sp. tritici TaxID=168172 RepID=UPI0020072231|nr:hypothetical protein Pst134EA_029452 [Puccinia striiformis f. sp. tritici]KAH9447413.1 hypothetical protein Pst134EA_029452 [Puccinia striiformis f. sp. tritici]KAI9624378.1 hypothetical protein KEM48_008961 [Puccinia striiformis f. sp. tritici PST-130]